MSLEAAGLTQAMMDALEAEWMLAKGSALPGAGLDDRRLLFAAVARGLLTYLESKQDELITTIELEQSGAEPIAHTVASLDLGITVA
jgi:hypothetical protein